MSWVCLVSLGSGSTRGIRKNSTFRYFRIYVLSFLSSSYSCFHEELEPEFVTAKGAQESIPTYFANLPYVAWRASTSKRVVVPARQTGNRFLGSLKGLHIRAQGYDPYQNSPYGSGSSISKKFWILRIPYSAIRVIVKCS
jgi:hypothetical protein